METFLLIICAILASLSLLLINLSMYKTMIDSMDDIPKWLNRVLLIPPFSFIAMLIIMIGIAVTDIANKLKKHW